MKINLALWDRILRMLLGIPLTIWSVAGGAWWGFFGIYLILTASWGWCPIYSWLRVRTARFKDFRTLREIVEEESR